MRYRVTTNCGNIMVDLDRGSVTIGHGRPMGLGEEATRMLEMMIQDPDHRATYDGWALARTGRQWQPNDRRLAQLAMQLRRVGLPLKTLRGVGYALMAHVSEDDAIPTAVPVIEPSGSLLSSRDGCNAPWPQGTPGVPGSGPLFIVDESGCWTPVMMRPEDEGDDHRATVNTAMSLLGFADDGALGFVLRNLGWAVVRKMTTSLAVACDSGALRDVVAESLYHHVAAHPQYRTMVMDDAGEARVYPSWDLALSWFTARGDFDGLAPGGQHAIELPFDAPAPDLISGLRAAWIAHGDPRELYRQTQARLVDDMAVPATRQAPEYRRVIAIGFRENEPYFQGMGSNLRLMSEDDRLINAGRPVASLPVARYALQAARQYTKSRADQRPRLFIVQVGAASLRSGGWDKRHGRQLCHYRLVLPCGPDGILVRTQVMTTEAG